MAQLKNVVEPFGEVNVYPAAGGKTRVVATILMEPQREGTQTGIALDGSGSMAKLYGGVKANEIVDRVLQIHGGMGYTRELPVERWYRELRLLRIYEGTDEILKLKVAAAVLGKEYEAFK